MSAECRREWLRHRPPDTPPDMNNLSRFIDIQKKELRGASTLTSGLPASSHLPTPSARPSSPRVDRSRTMPVKAPPPRRSAQHCPVCGDQHTLTRCSTFAAYNLERRNKIVREKKLCLNCFGEGHGCKSCPSKFSCRTCNWRHHSLLHRDREPATSTSPAPAMMSKADTPSRGVASLYSAMVAFNCNGRTVLARALLDAGASLSIMTESLATSLGLPRIHDPIPISGIAGTARCTHIVKSHVFSLDSRYKLQDVTFTVIPTLEPIRKPGNAAEILRTPELRQYSLADSDLGRRVDLMLGVTQTSALTTGTPFRVGKLLALPTQLGHVHWTAPPVQL